jgi:hypothetical protein
MLAFGVLLLTQTEIVICGSKHDEAESTIIHQRQGDLSDASGETRVATDLPKTPC